MEQFRAAHGRPPAGVWAAPGRVNLMGEHTDYNRGLCLPIALEHATYAAMDIRDDGGVSASSDRVAGGFVAGPDRLGPGMVSGWASYVAGILWAARRDGLDVPGVDIVVSSTVPVGAGLSSSAALECAVGIGLCELAGLGLDEAVRRRLVDICGVAEREVAGAPTGGMDQTVALFATSGNALLIDFCDLSTRAVPWSPEDDDLELVVIDTRVSHALGQGGYGDRRSECERAAAALGVDSLADVEVDDLARLGDPLLLRRARHVVTEIGRVELAVDAMVERDWARLGRLFDASHATMRDDFEISCPELDAACESARRAGAIGARMTGGGFGGSAIALVPTDRVAAVRTSVATEFAARNWNPPRFLPARAAGCAHRVV